VPQDEAYATTAGPVFLIETAGAHFAVPGAGWGRRPKKEERQLRCEITADNSTVGTLQCFCYDWNLTLDDLYDGILDFYRERVRRLKVRLRARAALAGQPAIYMEFDGVQKDPNLQFSYVAWLTLRENKIIEILGSAPVEAGEALRGGMAAIPASFSFAPLTAEERRRVLKAGMLANLLATGSGTPSAKADEMMSILFRGVLFGTSVGLVLGLLLALFVGGTIGLPGSHFWQFTGWAWFLLSSYVGAAAIAMGINKRTARLRFPGMGRSKPNPVRWFSNVSRGRYKGTSNRIQSYLAKVLGYFLVLGLSGLQHTSKFIFQFLVTLFRSGLGANRPVLFKFLVAAAIYLAPVALAVLASCF
jgi:hypothetical protein